MKKIPKKYQDQIRLRERAKNAARRANDAVIALKTAAPAGAAVGGLAGPMLAGRYAVGEAGEDKLGTDVAPFVGVAALGAGLAVPGALGVAVMSAGAATATSWFAMDRALTRAGLRGKFRAATLGKVKKK